MNCPNCGGISVVCETKEEKPTYKVTSYILPIVAIVIGLFAIALFIYVNGSDEVYSSRKVTRTFLVGIIFPIWGAYRLWKMKRATYEVTECVCSTCGATFVPSDVETAPVLEESQQPESGQSADVTK